jgi:hypothetical protein
MQNCTGLKQVALGFIAVTKIFRNGLWEGRIKNITKERRYGD